MQLRNESHRFPNANTGYPNRDSRYYADTATHRLTQPDRIRARGQRNAHSDSVGYRTRFAGHRYSDRVSYRATDANTHTDAVARTNRIPYAQPYPGATLR